MEAYSFRSVTSADLQLLNAWLKTPAVKEWWIEKSVQSSDAFSKEDLAQPNVAMWIVNYEDSPFAFIQDYDPHAWPGHHFSYLPSGSRGVDQFIGDPAMLGCGHGTAFIRAHVNTLMKNGAPAVGTDPHPSNARAIHAYEKVGFMRVRECATAWGLCLLMEISE